MNLRLSNEKVALLTFATGKYNSLLKLSAPLMKIYAELWGFSYFELKESLDLKRPISWSKLLAIENLLHEYEVVIYLDVDVMILKMDENILEDFDKRYDFAWRVASIAGKLSPNAGVMLFRSSVATKSLLRSAYEQTDLIYDGWWEQAALIRVLGYSDPRSSSIKQLTNEPLVTVREKKLMAKWNSTSAEADSGKANFRHFAGEPFSVRRLMMIEYLLYHHSTNSKVRKAISTKQLVEEYQLVNKEIHGLYSKKLDRFIFRGKSVLSKLKIRKIRYY